MSGDIIMSSDAPSPRTHPYTSSISSVASSSSSSIFSVEALSSQTSNTTSCASTSTNIAWDSEEVWARPTVTESGRGVSSTEAVSFDGIARANTFPLYNPQCRQLSAQRNVLPPLRTDASVPVEQRQNPRRTSGTDRRIPPPLVRQEERKLSFVDNLVVSATQMVEVIWPLSVPARTAQEHTGRGVLPLRIFIQETLRRSKTSYSTLQVALYYLVLIKAHVPKNDFTMEQPEDLHSYRALQCGRRMFLAALILASKYLQDRNYSARAWSKISGLKVDEINTNEMAFLHAVNWKLHITEPVFDRWQEVVLNYTPSHPPPSPPVGTVGSASNAWKAIIPSLTPELDTVELASRTPTKMCGPPALARKVSRPTLSMAFSSSISQDATPTPSDYKLPKFLEPQPDMLPPTPSLARMGPLPTPQLTPQSVASSTPGSASWARRPSMCSAMQQAQSASIARSAMDWNPSKPSCSEGLSAPPRRPSIATSTSSLASSPESMVSDNSSRSSRASSISSASSAGWAPSQTTKLCRLATCRNAKLAYLPLPRCKEDSVAGDYATSEPMSSPDLEGFHLDDDTTALPFRPRIAPSASDAAAKSRKRGRSSTDLSLQDNVRNLLNSSSPSPYATPAIVLADPVAAKSFLLEQEQTPTLDSVSSGTCSAKSLQSPKSTVRERRMPVQRDMGRKRTCCAQEAARTLVGMGRKEGVGKWEGLL